MFFIQFICISISIIGILAISLGSESESLLTCSKFHFEEKVLEKMIRLENKMEVYSEKIKLWEESVSSKLEHKMEVYAEKVKLWEESVSSSLNKVTEAMKQTETFVDSMRGAHLLDQTRFNDSFLEVKKQTKAYVESMRDAQLQDQTRFNDSFLEVKKQSEAFVDSMRNAHLLDQTRFNDSFIDVKKKAEIFIESMRNAQLQDQTRFNDSLLETIDRFKSQSKNETEYNKRQMNSLLDSFSSKIQELNEAERTRENTTKLSLLQEQNRFNKSFDKIAEDFQVRFNKLLQDIALKQQKVALTACATGSTVPGGAVVQFPNIKTNIGITDLSAYKSTGKFVCTVAGLYHVSAVMMTKTDGQRYYIYKNSDRMITTLYGKVHSYETKTSVFVTMLDVGDEITVRTSGSQYIYQFSCFTIVKLN
ncbi:uncharacterized protein LOC134686212 [Mytilus trossulus]|uniref:uncharacterized protein LOC134686212 n=1 Tax=Mytilus trossulus TaxID=6551 RepID=UPI003007A56A